MYKGGYKSEVVHQKQQMLSTYSDVLCKCLCHPSVGIGRKACFQPLALDGSSRDVSLTVHAELSELLLP
jgi:hypothetical protein